MNGLSTESHRTVGSLNTAIPLKRPVSLTVYMGSDGINKYGKQMAWSRGPIAPRATYDKCAISLTLIQMFIFLMENYDNNTVTVRGYDFIK